MLRQTVHMSPQSKQISFLKSNDGLSIMQINYRSLNKNFDKLDMLIDGLDKKPNIISIAE